MNLSKLTKTLRQKDARASFTRKVITVSALSLLAGQMYAQKGFDLGLRGTVLTSSLLNEKDQAAGPELDYKNKVNVGGGIAAGYNFDNHMGVELDILYSKQGQGYVGDPAQITPMTNGVLILSQEFQKLASANNIAFTTNYTANIALYTLKIPILFRYTGDAKKPWYFSSFIGPQINLLNSVAMQVNGANASFTCAGFAAIDQYKKTTIDAVVGVGVGINLSDNFVLGVHLRLDYGLNDVENKSEVPSGSTNKLYDPTRAATHNATGGGLISLNYKFIKKKATGTKATTTTKTKTTTKKK
jgi:hypothetical protein